MHMQYVAVVHNTKLGEKSVVVFMDFIIFKVFMYIFYKTTKSFPTHTTL